MYYYYANAFIQEYVELKDKIQLGIDNVEELFRKVEKKLQKQVRRCWGRETELSVHHVQPSLLG